VNDLLNYTGIGVSLMVIIRIEQIEINENDAFLKIRRAVGTCSAYL